MVRTDTLLIYLPNTNFTKLSTDTIPTPKCKNGKWTDFYDRDNPSGKGDYETLELLRETSPENICPKPINIDVVEVITGASYLTYGQNVVIGPDIGFYCVNDEQNGELCEDYKIRFCCPNGERSLHICFVRFWLKVNNT